MAWVKRLAWFAFSLVLTSSVPCLVDGQDTSVASTGTKWVRPIKDIVVVKTASGTTVEPIGVLTKDTVVEVVDEVGGWYKIRFVRENAEFLGWVAKEEVAVEGTPPKPPTRVVKPEPEPKQEKKEEPEEKILTIEETHEKLLKLREVPVSSGPMYKETYNLDGMRHTRSGSGSTGMALFGGQEASLQVLALFDPDEVVEWFVEERIRELKKLGQEAHPSFHRVIDWYIKGLEAYVERKPRDLERFVNQAERFWKTIPGVPEVGF